jgi:hypothetical protein
MVLVATVASVALVAVACGGSRGPAAVSSHLGGTRPVTTPSKSTTGATPGTAAAPSVVARLGTTLTLTATGQSPGEIAVLRVTLDRVIDPYNAPPLTNRGKYSTGYRWIALQFTVTNGGRTLPESALDDGDPDSLELIFALDPATSFDHSGDPLLISEASTVPVRAGQTITEDSPFQISDKLTVTSASAELMFAGQGPTTPADEWSIPQTGRG